jgi:hypothetical protein
MERSLLSTEDPAGLLALASFEYDVIDLCISNTVKTSFGVDWAKWEDIYRSGGKYFCSKTKIMNLFECFLASLAAGCPEGTLEIDLVIHSIIESGCPSFISETTIELCKIWSEFSKYVNLDTRIVNYVCNHALSCIINGISPIRMN